MVDSTTSTMGQRAQQTKKESENRVGRIVNFARQSPVKPDLRSNLCVAIPLFNHGRVVRRLARRRTDANNDDA